MKLLLSSIRIVAVLLAVLGIQFFVSYVLPYPLYTINCIVVFVVVYLLIKEKRHIVWYVTAILFLIELLNPSSVFGSVLVPGVMSTLLVYWCHRFFFTNRSLYTASILGAIMLISFRLMKFVYTFIAERVVMGSAVLPAFSGTVFLIEVLATELTLIIILFFLLKRKKML